MKQALFQIACGDFTCAPEPGTFCEYVRVKKFGTVFNCHLFEVQLRDQNGWLVRCKRCLETFKGNDGTV